MTARKDSHKKRTRQISAALAGQEALKEPVWTPERLRIKALAGAIAKLAEVPDEQDVGNYALPLAEQLLQSVKAMCRSAYCIMCAISDETCSYHNRVSKGENKNRD